MSSHFDEMPHVYFHKKYISLTRQDVIRGDKQYLYSGGTGVSECLQHLNNLNHVCGSTLIIVDSIAKSIGIKLNALKEKPEGIQFPPDQGLKTLVEDSTRTSQTFLNRMEILEEKISNLQVEKIQELVMQVQRINPDVMQEILNIVNRIDTKV